MITIFEDFNKNYLGKFKPGDVVYCIDDDNTSSNLKKDSKYEIIGILKNSTEGGSLLYNIKPLDDTDKYERKFSTAGFFEDRFVSELEYKANKYNL